MRKIDKERIAPMANVFKLLKRYPVRDLRDLPDIALIELELME
tara:strand:- start:305 stop:433 length:129 start_codon:yes stop_codon:yes gene_type:complete